MKNRLFFIKIALILVLILLSSIVSHFYFCYYRIYESNTLEISINRLITISFFITFFCSLLLLIDFNLYNKAFGIIITVGTISWIGIYLLEVLKIKPEIWYWSAIRDFSAIICLSILAPGLTLNIIKFIKNNSNQNKKKRRVFRKYHVHEGLVGVIFIILSIALLMIRYLMIQHEVLKKQLRIFLALDMILLYLFLFSGSFLVFRDRRDVLKLKFIEKRNSLNDINNSSVFSPITLDSIHFFKSPRILYYPIGILINSYSVNLLIHGTDLLGPKIFSLTLETIVLIGFILCFIAGFMIGMDWYRLFGKLYPDLYSEIELILSDLRNSK